MAKFSNPLNNVRVASPCNANWDEMYGSNRQRYCGECKLNVYNLSEMTKQEAEHLIANAEGRLCARFYRRTDGTIITKDCPVGWQAFKRNVSRFWTAAASVVLAALSGIGITSLLMKKTDPPLMGKMTIEKPEVPMTCPPPRPVQIEPRAIMGDVVYPEDLNRELGEVAVEEVPEN